MIEAYFDSLVDPSDDVNSDPSPSSLVPMRFECVMPNDDIREIADLAGFTDDDLFSIKQYNGLSRPTRIRCLVSAEDLPNLYRSTRQIGGVMHKACCIFKWRSQTEQYAGDHVPPGERLVWLMPPQPLFVTPTEITPTARNDVTGKGLYIVEAVDIKHWWNHLRADPADRNADHDKDWWTSSTGKYQSPQQFATVNDALDYYLARLPVKTMTRSGSVLNDYSLLEGIQLTPDTPPAMAIDLILSAVGEYVRDFDVWAGTVTIRDTDEDLSVEFERFWPTFGLISGGAEPTSGTWTPDPLDPMKRLMMGGGNASTADGQWYQMNRTTAKAWVVFPWRAVEGRTVYGRKQSESTSPRFDVLDQARRDFAVLQDATTARARPKANAAIVLHQASPLAVGSTYQRDVANYTTNGNLDNPSIASGAAANAMEVSRRRASVLYGTRCAGGWGEPGLANYRTEFGLCTEVKWTVRKYRGEWIPVMIARTDEDDWTLGPSGRLPTDPRELVYSRGAIHGRRLAGGQLQLDVAPPVRRAFLAKITSATRVGASGNDYWRWSYDWEEMQAGQNALSATVGATQDRADRLQGGFTTLMRARNTCEESNVFVATANASNFIAPGYSQADYPSSTMECQPIAVGTIVTMIEDFRDCWDTTNPTTASPVYWFTMPNVAKFLC